MSINLPSSPNTLAYPATSITATAATTGWPSPGPIGPTYTTNSGNYGYGSLVGSGITLQTPGQTPGQFMGSLTAGSSGSLYWNNNNQVAMCGETETETPTIKSLSDLLKDSLTRDIILCKDREECKDKFGAFGLQFYDSILNEVLQLGIKAEESFNIEMKKEQEKRKQLHDYILSLFPDDSDRKEVTLILCKIEMM